MKDETLSIASTPNKLKLIDDKSPEFLENITEIIL